MTAYGGTVTTLRDLFRDHFGRGSSSSLLELVLRGHLWVESFLNRLIKDSVEHPDFLNFDRMTFAAKVTWALALDAVSSDEAKWYRELNKVRNRLAHRLGGEPTHRDVEALLVPLEGISAEIAREPSEGADDDWYTLFGTDPSAPEVRLRAAFATQVVLLGHRCLTMEWHREHEDALRAVRLQQAIHSLAAEQTGIPDDSEERFTEWADARGIPSAPTPHDVLFGETDLLK